MAEKYLRSRQRRGRWFQTYRRFEKEISLGVHGLEPSDPRVKAAYWVEHAKWEHSPLAWLGLQRAHLHGRSQHISLETGSGSMSIKRAQRSRAKPFSSV